MGCWSTLEYDLMGLILDRLVNISDHYCFASVCSSWRSFVVNNRCHRQLPFDLFPASFNTKFRTFFSARRKMYKFYIPEINGKECCGSSEGWLIMVDSGSTGEIQLFNPVSRHGIQLPSLSTIFLSYYSTNHDPDQLMKNSCFEARYIHKAVLSSDPRLTKNYVVVAIVTDKKKLVYYRSRGGGAQKWIIMARQWDYFHDVIYHKGLFYAISSNGPLITCDFRNSEFPIITKIINRPQDIGRRCDRYHLVELLGELLLVLCHIRWLVEEVDDDDNDDHDIFIMYDNGNTQEGFKNFKFHVFKLDGGKNSKREWIQMRSIGNNVLFLGNCYSLLMPAYYYQGVKGNSIRIMEGVGHTIYNKSPSSWTIPTFRIFTPKTMVDLQYFS